MAVSQRSRRPSRPQHPWEKLRLTQHTWQSGVRHSEITRHFFAGVAEFQLEVQPESVPKRRVPQSLEEVDNGQIMGFGADLADDHPGYRDQAYKDRRRDIGNLARAHRVGDPIPRLEYTAEELHVWATVLRELKDLYPQHACAEFLRCLPLFKFNEHEVRAALQQCSSKHTGSISAANTLPVMLLNVQIEQVLAICVRRAPRMYPVYLSGR